MNKNCNEELSVKIVGKLSLLLPQLQVDLQKQLEIKREIDEIIYNYDVISKSKEITISDIREKINLYIACKKLEGKSKVTLRGYMYFLNKLDLFFNKPVGSITTMDLRLFLKELKDGRKEETINSYITQLRGFFGWLQNEEIIISNPAARLNKTKIPKRLKKPYKAENVERLRNACTNIRDKAIFEMLESTACRIGELVTMQVSNLNMLEQSITVIGKGNKERVVYFSTKARVYLEDYLRERKGASNYIFLTLKSPYKPIKDRGVRFLLSRLKESANVEERVYPHKFRRTKATSLLNGGMELAAVQKLLGHESPETTERYAILTQENVKYQYKRLTE
ncbi:MAG: tyrosine-type recombinase/integrase [Clostridium sp.]|uniref:tyrosine-type recombinase/integrase n=1 Tax=Clostridium sp. TaxID=1506 RepID=UPI00290A4DB8|nr:tyrosine-type recombinase/integrase [Clostridium sp.]MDU4939629.1 tyrosine-type recombinase/integrase [Clostridium sp.]